MSRPGRPPGAAQTVGVLVVSGGGFQGLGLVKSLRACGRVRVIMVDCHSENVGRYFVDEFRRVPRAEDHDAFLRAVLEICERDSIRVVLPSTDFELSALAEAREVFAERGVLVGVPDLDLLALVRHKGELHEALSRDGFSLLPRLEPRSSAFPMLGKPVSAWGSRGQIVVRSAEDLASVLPQALDRTHLWHPLLDDFEELSVDFSIDFHGVASGLGARRRVRTAGGFAVISDCAREPEAERLVERLVGWLAARGGRGLFNVQVLRAGSEWLISDVNPRMGTSAVHWCGPGPNPALHLCASADPGLAGSLEPSGATPPRRLVRYLAELRPNADGETLAAEVEGVVFDLDDTLIPHKRWILAKLDRLCDAAAELLPERSALLREAMSLVEEGHAGALLDRLAERHGWPSDVRTRLIETYRAAVPARCLVFADVWPTLETLRRRGLRLAVLTDNPPASQRQKLEASGLAACFDAIVYTREHGVEKPGARGFEEVAARLAVPTRRLAMVGDNPYRDVAGALRAGYALGYQVRRWGTLFNFDTALFAELSGGDPRRHVIDGLQPLLMHLHGAAEAHVFENPRHL